MNYAKQHGVVLLGLAVFSLGGFLGWYQPTVNVNASMPEQSSQTFGQSEYSTTVTAPYVFEENVTAQKSVSVSGTTTVTRSFDGFMAGGGIAPASVATNTVFTLYTHTGSPVVCDASQSILYADVTTFGTPLLVSVGTSTGGVATANLVASTTVGTTTDTLVGAAAAGLFVMNAGDRINAILADNVLNASSTHYSNWDIEFQTQCWLIGG